MTKTLFDGLYILQERRPDYLATGLVSDLFIIPDNIQLAAQRLLDAGYHLEDLSGMDTADGIMVTYHFDHFETPGRIALRVLTDHKAPRVPSIADVFGGAEWHERELTDFYGVTFDGNPNPAPLLLPADEVCTPLVKSEKARASIGALIKSDNIVHNDPSFDLFLPQSKLDLETEEAQP